MAAVVARAVEQRVPDAGLDQRDSDYIRGAKTARRSWLAEAPGRWS